MKTRRWMICASFVVLMLAALMTVPASTETTIIAESVPLGVGSGSAAAPQAPETGDENNDYPVAVTTNVSDSGILSVDIDTQNTGRMKLKVTKDGQTMYYDVADDHHADVPLQMGGGSYTVKVFRHIKDSDYQAVYTEDFSFSPKNETDVFLVSSDIVNFGESRSVKDITQTVVDGTTEDREIVSRIATYVIETYRYDGQKADTLTTDYVPDIDTIMNEKSGICYDFAAVTASMLRTAGIPTKLVMGRRSDSDLYHAWNEALVDGEWIIVDTTWDNVMNHHKLSFQDPGFYSADKVF